ncbi:MAG: phage baseplate assembly protein V [Planctomycetota bacterium]|nr:MAG: phage baseplate assembly protein V [Planctomycetota bacterium]
MIDPIRRLLEPLSRRLSLLVSRGTVKASNDARKIQELQVSLLAKETQDGLERFQQYGLTGRPFADAEALVVFLGGSRDHGIVIAVDDRRYRLLGLAEGEVALYDDQGNRVHLKRNHEIEVVAATKITLQATTVRVNGTLETTGDIRDLLGGGGGGSSMEEIRTIYNAHTHPGGGPPSPQMP